MGINKQLVKEKRKKTELTDKSFKVFNGEVTRFMLLELEINKHTEKIDVVVMDLNSTDMFLKYN